MAKQVKKMYRALAWVFAAVIASGTLTSCRPPATKYGPPSASSIQPTVTSYDNTK